MEKLAIQLSCYNGARYLSHLLVSLAAQTFTDWKLYVLDNASDADNAKAIREAVAVLGSKAVCSRVEQNIDFVGAHNLLWRFHASPFVQLLNDDAMLEPEYLARLVQVMETNPNCASATGLIYRWDFDRVNEPEKGKTNIVDSSGLERTATWKVSDRMAGTVIARSDLSPEALAKGEATKQSYGGIASPVPMDRVRNDGKIEPVFGVSGCLPMYRRDAIEKTSPDQLLFAPLFQSYKEDVDVAFRLNRAGFVSLLDTGAVTYHRRSFLPGAQAAQSWRAAFHSYRNHFWVLLYHLTWEDFKKDGFWIVLFELAKKMYWLLKRPAVVWQTAKETWTHRRELLARRKFYQSIDKWEGTK